MLIDIGLTVAKYRLRDLDVLLIFQQLVLMGIKLKLYDVIGYYVIIHDVISFYVDH